MSLFISRIKNWLGYENLATSDLNAEFNNIVQKAGADVLSGANSTNGTAATVGAMQVTSSPGAVGTENLANSVQDDIRQLRYQLNAIIGGAQWYSPPAATLSSLAANISGLYTYPSSRVISGRATTFGQPAFLVPNGSAATVALKATATNLSTYINGTALTQTFDLSLTSLQTAPASNNTCVVNDNDLGAVQATKVTGERGTVIQITTIGSSISALNGTVAAFKVGTEYFIGEVYINATTLSCTFTNATPTVVTTSLAHGLNTADQVLFTGGSLPTGVLASTVYYATVLSSTTFQISSTNGGGFIATSSTGSATGTIAKNNVIRECFRGVGFDSSDNWIARTTLTLGTTITLCKLTYIFLTSNGSAALALTYNRPIVSYVQPTGPSIGDYWYDLSTQSWKTFTGSVYVVTAAVYVGICIQDTANCVAARSVDFFNIYNELNTIEPEYQDDTTVRSNHGGSRVSVYGTTFSFDTNQPFWNTNTDMGDGLTLAPSTFYYLYITLLGKRLISDICPTERKFDLLGGYHPAKPYRCVGEFRSDSGSLVTSVQCSNHHQRTLPYKFGCPGTFRIAGSGGSQGGGSGGGATLNVTNPLGIPALNISIPLDRASLPLVGQTITSSCGAFSTTSTSLVTVTNLSATVFCTGRPLLFLLQNDGAGLTSLITTTSSSSAALALQKNGVNVFLYTFNSGLGSATAMYLGMDTVSAGTVTYTVKAQAAASQTFSLYYYKLVVYEL